MDILEVFNKCSDEAVIQTLRDNLVNATLTKKQGTRVTFVTDQITPTEIMHGNSKMVGYVVWIPRDTAKRVLAAETPTRVKP